LRANDQLPHLCQPAPLQSLPPLDRTPSASRKIAWRPLRKGVADLHRRAQVCQHSNHRYIDALAAVEDSTRLREILDPVSTPVSYYGRRVRPLRIGTPPTWRCSRWWRAASSPPPDSATASSDLCFIRAAQIPITRPRFAPSSAANSASCALTYSSAKTPKPALPSHKKRPTPHRRTLCHPRCLAAKTRRFPFRLIIFAPDKNSGTSSSGQATARTAQLAIAQDDFDWQRLDGAREIVTSRQIHGFLVNREGIRKYPAGKPPPPNF
jgi:hypothetical protein